MTRTDEKYAEGVHIGHASASLDTDLSNRLRRAHTSTMNERVKILSEEAAKLTPEERIELVERINLSLLHGGDALEDEWENEAADRFGAYERGEMQALSWEEVKNRRTPK